MLSQKLGHCNPIFPLAGPGFPQEILDPFLASCLATTTTAATSSFLDLPQRGATVSPIASITPFNGPSSDWLARASGSRGANAAPGAHGEIVRLPVSLSCALY